MRRFFSERYLIFSQSSKIWISAAVKSESPRYDWMSFIISSILFGMRTLCLKLLVLFDFNAFYDHARIAYYEYLLVVRYFHFPLCLRWSADAMA